MSDNFLRSRRDSCEHAFNREIAETTNDTARTTCCSIDEFLSECFITGTGFRWFLTRNLSSDGTSRSIAIDYRCLTRSVRGKALILFLMLESMLWSGYYRTFDAYRSARFFGWNDRLIYIRVAVTFERLHRDDFTPFVLLPLLIPISARPFKEPDDIPRGI